MFGSGKDTIGKNNPFEKGKSFGKGGLFGSDVPFSSNSSNNIFVNKTTNQKLQEEIIKYNKQNFTLENKLNNINNELIDSFNKYNNLENELIETKNKLIETKKNFNNKIDKIDKIMNECK